MLLNLENKRYMQYLAALSANLCFANLGMSTSWPSPTLSKFQSEDSPTGTILSDEELSWVVSTLFIASLPSSFFARWSVDYFGRKRTLLLTGVLCFIHWIILIFATSLTHLIVGRSLAGIAMGIGIPAIVIYSAEISEEDIRGRLGTYINFLKTCGMVTVLVIGPNVSYTVITVICASVPVIFFFCFILMPEAPYYYIKIGKKEEAIKSLVKLSRKNEDEKFFQNRMQFIQSVVEEDMKNKGNYKDLLTKKEFRWTLFLLFGIKTLQQFCGFSALEAYLQPIIESSNSGLEAETASIIIGCIQLPAVFLSGILVDKLGRKPLLIISATFCCIALLGEGTYFLIQDYFEKNTTAIGWLPTVGLALFWITSPIGIITLPYVLLGELFPTNVKGAAVSLATVYGGTSAFLVSKFFKPLSNSIGIYSMFYIFAGVCFVGALFVFFFLPETKGKNFQQIQELLNDRKERQRTRT